MDTTGKEWFIEVPWGRMCVLAWGSCLDPPVLLVHGMDDNAASFTPLISGLPPKFYYVAIELPGFGRSNCFPPGMMISMYELVYTIDVVVKHFRWSNFGYIGHDLGAIVGKLYNHSIPNNISKLIEIDPTNFTATEPEDFANWYHMNFTKFYKNYHRFNLPAGRFTKVNRVKAIKELVEKRKIKEEDLKQILARCTIETPDGNFKHTMDPRYKVLPTPPFSAEYIRSAFLTTTTPTLHILSSESIDNKRFGNTSFLQDKASYPNNNYWCVVVEGCHDIHIQRPDKVAPVIGKFLLGSDIMSKL